MKDMKNTILAIALMLVSTIALGQRKIPMATRYCPTMENQVTKEDSLRDDSMLEYTEREFQGVEEDTAFLNNDMREREALKKGKITDPEREINTFDYEKIFFTDKRDFEKSEKEEKAKAKKQSSNATKPE